MKNLGMATAAVSLMAVPATALQEAADASETETGAANKGRTPGWHDRELRFGNSAFRFYGFARLDVIYDDSRPDALQTPTFIESEAPMTGAENQSSLTVHPRLSRFGVELNGPELESLGAARLGGKLEVDFQNGGRESRAQPRYRHAYLSLVWDRSTLLAGQTWDLISPLYPTVNSDTLMWNAGNLGDRRAQVRWTLAGLSGVSFAAAVGLTGAVDDQDLDDNGVLDGEDAGVPNLQARTAWSRPMGAGELEVGLWGHIGREELERPVNAETRFDTQSVGLDLSVPFPAGFTLRGEAWTGENLSDFRGGIGQGVDIATGEEISSRGGWIELGWNSGGPYSAFAGATEDDPDDAELGRGARTKNGALYLVQRLDFDGALQVGLDYLHWTTEYVGLDEGTDNRFNLYLVYFF